MPAPPRPNPTLKNLAASTASGNAPLGCGPASPAFGPLSGIDALARTRAGCAADAYTVGSGHVNWGLLGGGIFALTAFIAQPESIAGCVVAESFCQKLLDLFDTEAPAVPDLATAEDEAVFWSGIRGSEHEAGDWAAKNGGITLEQAAEERGIDLPKFDRGNPSSVAAWERASAEFASHAAGDVRVLTSGWSTNSVWARIEFPALTANPNVTSVTAIDPRTGIAVRIWSR